MNVIKGINRFFLLATAPLFGLLIALALSGPEIDWINEPDQIASDPLAIDQNFEAISTGLQQAEETAKYTVSTIRQTAELYHKTTNTMTSIVQTAKNTAAKPESIYNRRITAKLGTPKETIKSDRIILELYKVNPGNYKGYALKVKLKSPDAMKMTLGGDKLGGSETTKQAVSRYGAAAGINAGGFADSKGKRYPLSTTMMNGKYLNGFEASYKDLFFVGMNKNGKLIGGKFHNKEELDKLEPSYGASFVPILLKNGQKTTIPLKWQTSPLRAPRTVIGNYKDDQLIILVIDGYDENGNSGATLQELQSKLFNMGVVNAYNLDGGGSSSLVFNGKVINTPSDGQLRPVPTHFLFFK
ncbi:phosphodiester glycosidase family protein [Paenibacillus bouchesdurhonensis]|uniref:phosphodiester glycosidase family protein n=1 Tax=Paenibacillus bouchesdurhonensis TaxID=1870990 RepID=UPI000DA61C38|nr:phosphodiester glycosidase family protein [Paenibacillus bouchesdurhonensis]